MVIDKEDNININAFIISVDKPDVSQPAINVVIANKDKDIAGSISDLAERTRINELYAQGAANLLTMNFLDNADAENPAIFEFYLPADMVNINQALLRIKLLPFRGYSKAIKGGGSIETSSESGGVQSVTSTSGGGTTATSTDGGRVEKSSESGGTTTSDGSSRQTVVAWGDHRFEWQPTVDISGTVYVKASGGQFGGETNPANGEGSHFHSVKPIDTNHVHTADWELTGKTISKLVMQLEHSHDMSHTHTIKEHSHTIKINDHKHEITIAAHSHDITINPHSHNVTINPHDHRITLTPHSHTIKLPNHVHEIEFGIFRGTTAKTITLKIDEKVVATTNLDNIDIAKFLKVDGGGKITRNAWHKIEIIPDALTRISANLYLNIFTNPRTNLNL